MSSVQQLPADLRGIKQNGQTTTSECSQGEDGLQNLQVRELI
jgi:hypothetical protein